MRLWWQRQSVRLFVGAQGAKTHGWLLAALALFVAVLYAIVVNTFDSVEIVA